MRRAVTAAERVVPMAARRVRCRVLEAVECTQAQLVLRDTIRERAPMEVDGNVLEEDLLGKQEHGRGEEGLHDAIDRVPVCALRMVYSADDGERDPHPNDVERKLEPAKDGGYKLFCEGDKHVRENG